ncbi:MAG TPA: hypothetical protein VE685_07005, partial [Thermoanaerobaculia bacterium]|nr:hypothetical protein [Thermoanaerobaculia bacterium]
VLGCLTLGHGRKIARPVGLGKRILVERAKKMMQNIRIMPHSRALTALRQNDMHHLPVDLPHIFLEMTHNIDYVRHFISPVLYNFTHIPHRQSVLRHLLAAMPHNRESALE